MFTIFEICITRERRGAPTAAVFRNVRAPVPIYTMSHRVTTKARITKSSKCIFLKSKYKRKRVIKNSKRDLFTKFCKRNFDLQWYENTILKMH